MRRNYIRWAWLAAGSLAGSAAAAEEPTRRYAVADADLASRMLTVREIVRAPDWSNYRIYPLEARRRNQEGIVAFQITVGADGVPSRCIVFQSSGYVELDDGTCDLGMAIRFEPSTGTATFRTRLVWRLNDPTTFGPARAIARVSLANGVVRDCVLSVEGQIPREMPWVACRVIGGQGSYLFGRRPSLRRATVVLEFLPTGAAPLPSANQLGRLFAVRRTSFRLARNGDLADCQVIDERGFGTASYNYAGPCGFFLTQVWIVPGRGTEPSGSFQISVYDADDSE